MKRTIAGAVALAGALMMAACTQDAGGGRAHAFLMGPGDMPAQKAGSFPMGLAGNGQVAVASDMGSTPALWSVVEGKPMAKMEGRFYGLAMNAAGEVYVARGAGHAIDVMRITPAGKVERQREIATKAEDFPAGVGLDEAGHLYVTNQNAGGMASFAAYDLATGKELGRYVLKDSKLTTTHMPAAVAVMKDGSKAWVASAPDHSVWVVDTRAPEEMELIAQINVGAHPVAMAMDKEQGRVYVANAGSDTVSVIDTAMDLVVDTIALRPAGLKKGVACTPTSVALSTDDARLYVALGDMKAVAVLSLTRDDRNVIAKVLGYMPVAGTPTGIEVMPDQKRLRVTYAQGEGAEGASMGMVEIPDAEQWKR